EVLIEREARDPGHLLGRTRGNKVVSFPSEGHRIGTYTEVEIASTTGPTFQGYAVDSLESASRA
ncbi:MAG: TRAM domain-containing protein, partial [Gemmatimonadota bacterium]